jgi:hypothetical protein
VARVLIGCEFSGVVRRAFAARGHDAWSCDLLPAEDRSNKHIIGDVRTILDDGWDLLAVFHPPCTRLCNSGVKHLFNGMKKINGINPAMWCDMEEAAAFFKVFLDCAIPKVAIENPIMHGHGKKLIGAKQTQIIQPWMHGHREMKATCLWLKNLLPLVDTDNVGPPPTDPNERKKWARVHRASPGPDRWKERSRTLTGIAKAMASQWGSTLAQDDGAQAIETERVGNP